jgi:hypothetical protein
VYSIINEGKGKSKRNLLAFGAQSVLLQSIAAVVSQQLLKTHLLLPESTLATKGLQLPASKAHFSAVGTVLTLLTPLDDALDVEAVATAGLEEGVLMQANAAGLFHGKLHLPLPPDSGFRTWECHHALGEIGVSLLGLVDVLVGF